MANDVAERRNYYVGEKSNQLRDGYGVYFYANKFFRYEGDWVKGKKHGHGKLLMADGSYYEGEFKNGEIEGHGFRKFQNSGNTYSGEFVKGEMHGHGVMNYANGSQFQGEFYRNQRHGTGILRNQDMTTYEGSWYKNKKHGQGVQSYPNGDEYEGDWVEGCRHGQGDLNSVDGTIYEGQWREDMFNGQGSIVHASGFQFEGLWINGRPSVEAAEIIVLQPPNQRFLTVQQGKRFSLNLQLLDANKESIKGEHGREFKVSAGYRYAQSPRASRSQSLLELIEDIEAKPISTPFGYDLLPYPIVESLKDFNESEEMLAKRKSQQSPVSSRVFGGESIPESKEAGAESQKTDEPADNADDGSSTLSESKCATSETNMELSDEVVDDDTGSNSTRLLPPPAPQRSSVDGLIEFQDLLLPSAPPNYRPFLQEDEVQSSESLTPTGSVSSLRRGHGAASVSSSSVRSDKNKKSRGSRTASAASTSSSTVNDAKTAKGKVKPLDLEEKGAKSGKVGARKKQKEQPKFQQPKQRKSPGRRGQDTDSKVSVGSPVKKGSDPTMELLNLMYAKEGDYVVIVEEVTNPPFLGKLLPPAFVRVKVVGPKKTAKKQSLAPGKK